MMPTSLEPLLAVYVFILGACLGSFANVVIARLPAQESLVRPRSRCPGCHASIAWYDNLPMLSYLCLRGRCRACRQSIAARYPLVELLTAGLLLALWAQLGPSWTFIIWVPLTLVLVCIIFLDLDHFWIPDVLTLPAALWLLATSFLPQQAGFLAALVGLLPALGLWGVGAAYGRLTGREGLGLGDVKLLAVLGLAVGWRQALTLLLWASLEGALVGTLMLAVGGHRGALDGPVPAALADDADWQPPAHAVPFGPFLILGALQVVLLPQYFSRWHGQLVQALMRQLGLSVGG